MDHAAFAYLAPFAAEADLAGIVGLWENSPFVHRCHLEHHRKMVADLAETTQNRVVHRCHLEHHRKMVADLAETTQNRVSAFWALFRSEELLDLIRRNDVTILFPTSRFSFENIAIARELTRHGLKDCDPGGWAMNFEDADFDDLLARLEEPENADEE